MTIGGDFFHTRACTLASVRSTSVDAALEGDISSPSHTSSTSAPSTLMFFATYSMIFFAPRIFGAVALLGEMLGTFVTYSSPLAREGTRENEIFGDSGSGA